MSVKVLIVDDEAPARRKVRALLASERDAEVVGEAGSGPEAVEAIRRLAPDLVFLDVQMPGMTGFEVIEAVGPDSMPAVVFVTAYDEFALEAFDVQAVDYLLKPVQRERFQKALQRASERVAARAGEGERLGRLLASLKPASRYLGRLVVRKGESLVLVAARDVVRLSADGNYVTVRTVDGTYSLRETLAALEAKLDPARFVRIHRAEIVNADFVREIQPWFHGDHVVVLKNGEEIRMSRRYQDRLLGTGKER